MSELTVRRLTSGGSDQIIGLWTEIFGDGRELVESFLSCIFTNGTGFGAFDGEKLAGMAFIMTGLQLSGRSAGYVYAVATPEEYRRRGIAAELCRECAESAKAMGCEIILVRPAEDRLYSYYGRVIGTEQILCCRREAVSAVCGYSLPDAEPVSAEEYYVLREKSLFSVPHLSVSREWLEFEKKLSVSAGGNLYSVGGSPAVCYFENGRLSVKELLCPDEERLQKISALCRKLGTGGAEYLSPDPEGERYLAADGKGILPESHFGILFD